MTPTPNPWRGVGLAALDAYPAASRDAGKVASLLERCPAHRITPLVDLDGMIDATLLVKDERTRMGLGSFKALGAAYAIARIAADRAAEPGASTLQGETYVAASAGNHGLSVAAGAAHFGAQAIIYLADTVPDAFAERLSATGAQVVRAGSNYEASMARAREDAEAQGWTLLSDSSWEGYTHQPRMVMEGYLQMAAEAVTQAGPITHVFLQAGVGGLAAAVTAHVRATLGDGPIITIVEPDHAPALHASLAAGRAAHAPGPVSSMGRLDCKDPSLVALKELAMGADFSMTISETQVADITARLFDRGLPSTPSGVAGIAGVLALTKEDRRQIGLTPASRVLTFLSEGAAG